MMAQDSDKRKRRIARRASRRRVNRSQQRLKSAPASAPGSESVCHCCKTNRQLDALGLVVKRGTLVDPTLIAASVKRPPYGSGGVNPRDPDAR